MRTINAVVETPRGYNQKYNFDAATGFFKLKKILPAGMVFPYDFGFIPGTKGQDGDPLDVIVISEFKNFAGSMMECRLIGCIQALQSEPGKKNKKIRNDRFLAVPTASVMFETVRSVKNLPPKIITQLEFFFINYNKSEDKDFVVTAIAGPAKAEALVKKSRLVNDTNLQ